MTFYKKFGKRLFDIIFSLLALPFLLPFLLIGAASVLLSDGRPIFFKQQRVGQDGNLFTMWKFRTMYTDQSRFAEVIEKEDRSTWTDGIPTTFVFKDNADDPRITPVGRWLRKTSLDELPQIFNVLAGQMSIVGPRPETPSYVSYYSPYQMARFVSARKRARTIRCLGIAHQVHFTGDQQDVMSYLKEADVFVLMSNFEGLPIAIIEAMAVGLPIVASKVGGVGELVHDGENGFTVANKPEDLRDALAAILTDDMTRQTFGQRSREKFESAFQFKRTYAETLQIYHKVRC